MNFKKLSIIIPAYNEKNTIKEIIHRVKSVKLPVGLEKEIIVVDDGSKDGTREILKTIPDILYIPHEKNLGKGGALKTGFRAATGDYLLIQDADLEYDPDDYISLLKPVLNGEAETVFGSRILRPNNVPVGQVYFYGGLLLTKLFNLLFSSRLTDLATCYKLFPSHFVAKVKSLSANDFVFDVVELSHLIVRRSKLIEVPISYHARSLEQGKKLNWYHGWRCFWAIIRLRLSPARQFPQAIRLDDSQNQH